MTFPKFNRSPLKSHLPNRKIVFQPPFFKGYVKLAGVYLQGEQWLHELQGNGLVDLGRYSPHREHLGMIFSFETLHCGKVLSLRNMETNLVD